MTYRTSALLCFAFGPTALYGQPALLGSRAPEQQLSLAPPALLVLPAGTVITVEAAEILSSDRQQTGERFTAQLHHPLVVDGWVVARAGQTVVGRIAGAKNAGRIKGTSKLAMQLEEIVLVDGQQAYFDLASNSEPCSGKTGAFGLRGLDFRNYQSAGLNILAFKESEMHRRKL